MVATSRSKAKTQVAVQDSPARRTRSASGIGTTSSSAAPTPAPVSRRKPKSTKKQGKVNPDPEPEPEAPSGETLDDKPEAVASESEPSQDAEVKVEHDKPVQDTPMEAPKSPAVMTAPSPSTTTTTKSRSKTSTAKGKRAKQVHCLCEGTDDGTPMIKCEAGCRKWYHFRCISLSEKDAEEIVLYICSACESSTGMKTVYDWEGPQAFEQIPQKDDKQKADKASSKPPKPLIEYKEEDPSEDGDDGSEDDYVAEAPRMRAGRRPARKVEVSDHSESDSEDSDMGLSKRVHRASHTRRATKASASPAPTGLKRKASNARPQTSKRPKDSEASAHDDPMRKYCLGKLGEVIGEIFREYPVLKDGDAMDVDGAGGAEIKEKAPLTDEEKQAIERGASAFVAKLEECIFATYAEMDKGGRQSAGGKYKERFRMLTFNLGKSDRVVLRKGIASGRITPSQLSVMSSTDLANEQTKQEIQIAEKESLEHSILKKMTAPRAKITHKGFEDIEGVDDGLQRDRDERRKEEEEERMEREKLARLRAVVPVHGPLSAQHAETSSAGPPPESSSVPMWGGPPPVPMHAQQGVTSPSTSRPVFMPSASDMMTHVEEGLSLTDLINIDEDSPPRDMPPPFPAQVHAGQEGHAPNLSDSGSTSAPSPEVTTPSGPSPFAPSRPLESPSRPSFDLSSLWNGASEGSPVTEKTPGAEPSTLAAAEGKEIEIDLDGFGEDADDQDFDMFLDGDEKGAEREVPSQEEAPPPPPPEPAIEELPRVWSGSVCMPLDSLSPLTIAVAACQIGGRDLGGNAALWKVLFPSGEVRVDGRVQIPASSAHILNSRLNVQRELIAVCFTPPSEGDVAHFNEFVDYFVTKQRHALVFPWGHHPKPTAPGKEFYIIPLLKDEPVPECIDMLDDLQLPKSRNSNVLLGVFVLTKGRLVAPPSPPSPPPPAVGYQAPAPPLVPVINPAPLLTAAAPVIAPTELAAEIASLTPEQIAAVLRHLGSQAGIPPPMPPVIPGIPVIPPPPPPSAAVAPMPPFPPPSQGFHPSYQQPPPGPPAQPPRSPGGYGQPSGYGDYDRGDYQRRPPYDRDDRGQGGRGRGYDRGYDRGRVGPRGRGRGGPAYGGDRDRDRPWRDEGRMSSSGWSGRGRNDGPSRSPPHGRPTRFGDVNHKPWS